MPTCSAYGCTSSTRNKGNREKGIFFHDFPKRDKSPDRFQQWVKYCNRRDFEPGVNLKSACLCSRHFEMTDLDESQLLKIKMMPEANLRGPRLKPGVVPTVVFNNVEHNRRTSKIPHVPVKTKINDESNDGHPSKKIRFSTSLIKWRDSIVEKQPDGFHSSLDERTKFIDDKEIQCELGLEMYRYSTDQESRLTESDTENSDINGRVKKELESGDDTNEDESNGCNNDNGLTLCKEVGFAAWGNLLLLFRICNVCSKEVNDIKHGISGDKVYVKSLCSCGNKVTWTSQPS